MPNAHNRKHPRRWNGRGSHGTQPTITRTGQSTDRSPSMPTHCIMPRHPLIMVRPWPDRPTIILVPPSFLEQAPLRSFTMPVEPGRGGGSLYHEPKSPLLQAPPADGHDRHHMSCFGRSSTGQSRAFHRPVRIRRRSVAWRTRDIRQWLQSRRPARKEAP